MAERNRAMVPLVIALAVAVSAADVLLPQQIETNFFYTVPVLLCARTARPMLPLVVLAIAVVWSVGVNLYLLLTMAAPGAAFAYEVINDCLGLVSVAALALFTSRRMRRETEMSDIISFIDGRLSTPDNTSLRRLMH